MFRKKSAQLPESGRRRTTTKSQANKVFSYYANRNPYEGARARDTQRGSTSESATAERSKRGVKKTGQLFVGGILLILLLVAAGYNATLTPSATVRISGKPEERLLLQEAHVYQSAAEDLLADALVNKTKLTIDTDAISQQILRDYPELSKAGVVLPLVGRTVKLEVVPAPVAARLIASDGKSYVLASDGRAISTDSTAVPASSPVLTDQSGLAVSVGGQVLPRDDMQFITRLQYQFASRDQAIISMHLPAAGRQLHVKLDGAAYYIKFSFEGDVLQQVGAYVAVQKRLSREGVKPAEYIDVRVGDRAYYK